MKKKFSEVKTGDSVFILIDRYNNLKLSSIDGVGLTNSNYGVIICSKKVLNNPYDWHCPRTDNGLLVDMRIEPVTRIEPAWTCSHYYENGVRKPKTYPEREIDMLHYFTITKKDGEESCLKVMCDDGGYGRDQVGYVFTTKEELEEFVMEIINVAENNIMKIKNSIGEL